MVRGVLLCVLPVGPGSTLGHAASSDCHVCLRVSQRETTTETSVNTHTHTHTHTNTHADTPTTHGGGGAENSMANALCSDKFVRTKPVINSSHSPHCVRIAAEHKGFDQSQ